MINILYQLKCNGILASFQKENRPGLLETTLVMMIVTVQHTVCKTGLRLPLCTHLSVMFPFGCMVS